MLLLDYQNVLIQNVLTERIHGFVSNLAAAAGGPTAAAHVSYPQLTAVTAASQGPSRFH
jgi:hypothetical protein